jgi:hypothetical protein
MEALKLVCFKSYKVQPWAGTEGRRRYRSNPFETSEPEMIGWSEARLGRFTPGTDRFPTLRNAGQAS